MTKGDLQIINDSETITYQKLFNQTHGKSASDRLVAGYIVAMLHHWISISKASLVSIDVGSKPVMDKKHKENKERLKGLPNGFKTTMWFNKSQEDGIIQWDESSKNAPSHNDENFEGLSQSSLEVGYSDIETLFFHVKQGRTFSKWSYDSKCIYIFALNKNEWSKFFNGINFKCG